VRRAGFLRTLCLENLKETHYKNMTHHGVLSLYTLQNFGIVFSSHLTVCYKRSITSKRRGGLRNWKISIRISHPPSPFSIYIHHSASMYTHTHTHTIISYFKLLGGKDEMGNRLWHKSLTKVAASCPFILHFFFFFFLPCYNSHKREHPT
jgi:hypothetical protein